MNVSYVKLMFRGLNELSKLKPSEDTKDLVNRRNKL